MFQRLKSVECVAVGTVDRDAAVTGAGERYL